MNFVSGKSYLLYGLDLGCSAWESSVGWLVWFIVDNVEDTDVLGAVVGVGLAVGAAPEDNYLLAPVW